MTQDEFQTLVLKELSDIKSDVWTLKWDMDIVKKDITSLHNKFDRLDDRVDEVESNLRQEIRLQWAYLNQAFDRMSYMQQAKNDFQSRV